MTNQEIENFRKYIGKLDASFDEFQMLISLLVREAAEEHTHRTYMDDLNV